MLSPIEGCALSYAIPQRSKGVIEGCALSNRRVSDRRVCSLRSKVVLSPIPRRSKGELSPIRCALSNSSSLPRLCSLLAMMHGDPINDARRLKGVSLHYDPSLPSRRSTAMLINQRVWRSIQCDRRVCSIEGCAIDGCAAIPLSNAIEGCALSDALRSLTAIEGCALSNERCTKGVLSPAICDPSDDARRSHQRQ